MDFTTQLKKSFDSLRAGQKLTLIAVFLGVLTILGVLGTYLNTDAFSPLYIRLSPDDAARVVEQLKSENVPYRLSDAGTSIRVPASKVFDLRLKLSMSGLPSGGGSGFELFDKAAFGMTDFAQEVNYQRALQGELSRTISELESVQHAKVHLVFPESSPFFNQTPTASASVALTLQPGAVLDKRQLQGIVHLVASAVKGLKPEDVTVVDAYGSLLSGGMKAGSLLATGDQMLELQHNVEEYLEQKGMGMLNRILGPDHAMLRISAVLDTQVIREQSEVFDPSNVVRSEQATADRSAGNSESTVKNYEVGKTVRQVVASPGTIKRLNVSLVVDGVTKDNVTTPRSDQELKNLGDLLKQAIGFNEEREDRIEVRSMNFDTQEKAQQAEQMVVAMKKLKQDRLIEGAMGIAGKGVIAGSMIAIVLFLIRALKQLPVAPEMAPAMMPGLAAGGSEAGALPAGNRPAAALGAPSAGAPALAAKSAAPEVAAVPALSAADSAVVVGELVKAAKENPAEVARLLQRGLGKK